VSRTPHTWADFPVAHPPDTRELATRPDPVELHHDGRVHRRVGDSGWHMTVCWYAGPEHVARIPDEPGWHSVRTRFAATGADSGEPVVEYAERTEADQDIIEEAANDYLAEAGIPPRPRGFTWFLEVPPGRSLADLWSLISERERQLPTRSPRADETATAMGAAVARFFS
jgi:hypothetical protein